MKATKKQIEDVREEARKAGYSEEKALNTLTADVLEEAIKRFKAAKNG